MDKLLLLERRWYAHPSFPCSVFDLYGHDSIFATHWHDEIEILFAANGQFEIMLNGIPYLLPSGAAAVVNSGELHTARYLGEGSGNLRLVVFHPELWIPASDDGQLKDLVKVILDGDKRLPVIWLPDQSAQAEFIMILRKILDLGTHEDVYCRRLAVRGLLCLLLSEVSENDLLQDKMLSKSDRRQQIDRIKAPLQYIQQNYQTDLRLADLAKMANFSESHFARLFRQILGQSVFEYLIEYRLRQAARLLDSTDARVTDIALNCGFTNLGYFVRSFRNRYQMPPNAWRKRLRRMKST